MAAPERMTDGEFGTWQCSNQACENSELTGMEARRRVYSTQKMLPPEPAEIRCGKCGVVTMVPQV